MKTEHDRQKAIFASLSNRSKIRERVKLLRMAKDTTQKKPSDFYKVQNVTGEIDRRKLFNNALKIEESNLDKKLLTVTAKKLSNEAIKEFKKNNFKKDSRLTNDDKIAIERKITDDLLHSIEYMDSAPNPNSTTWREIINDPTAEGYELYSGNSKGNGRNAFSTPPHPSDKNV